MTRKLTSSDIFDINKKTGALILGKNRLDDYATKYLTKHCKKALMEPMPLPIDEIFQEVGLTVQEASLSCNLDIFGCCLLLDGEVDIYDDGTDEPHSTFYSAGTVLIDPKSESVYGEGAKRNTLIHEALHWEKDKTFFAIMAVKNAEVSEKLYPIMCRQSETFFEPQEGKKTKENEVKWLEWQAHRLAPRVLMPQNSFKKKAFEIIENQKDSLLSCDLLIEELSDFFIVSRESVKYRLLEVGLEETISTFDDYANVYEEIKENTTYVKLSALEAYELLSSNNILYQWIKEGNFIFAEGYFVLAKSEYVTLREGTPRLTSKAKRNLSKCVLNICEHRVVKYQNYDRDFQEFAYLTRGAGTAQKAVTFHPKSQSKLNVATNELYHSKYQSLDEYDMDEEIQLTKMLGDPTTSLCNCLWFLMEKRKWNYPEQFNEKTELHKNYHGKIKNDKCNNMKTNTLMAICVGLQLTLRIVEKIFNKSDNKLDFYKDPDMTYAHILEWFPGISLMEFNDMLESKDLPKLETKSRN
ncbi:MAG: ImmA/IrrE family metallo-endopeptidase [Velocimicrobium sp.]